MSLETHEARPWYIAHMAHGRTTKTRSVLLITTSCKKRWSCTRRPHFLQQIGIRGYLGPPILRPLTDSHSGTRDAWTNAHTSTSVLHTILPRLLSTTKSRQTTSTKKKVCRVTGDISPKCVCVCVRARARACVWIERPPLSSSGTRGRPAQRPTIIWALCTRTVCAAKKRTLHRPSSTMNVQLSWSGCPGYSQPIGVGSSCRKSEAQRPRIKYE